MNKCILFVVLLIIFCNPISGYAENYDKNIILAALISTPLSMEHCSPASSFRQALFEHEFSVGAAELIEKSEIPNIADNIKSIKKLFSEKEEVFDRFSTLSRYYIKKNNSKINARFYCLKFSKKEDARAWFEVINRSAFKNKRLIIFKKPKKVMVLSGEYIYLIEGYHITNYDVLHFIVDQLTEVDAVFSPAMITNK